MSPARKQAAPSINPEMTVDGPALNQLVPDTLVVGGPPTTIDLYGTGFDSTCVVQAGGVPRTTFFIDDGHLQETARPDIQNGPASVQVTVQNGAGQISNALTFTYTGPPGTATIEFWTCDCGLSISASRPAPAPPICICQRTMYPVQGKAPKVLYDVVFVDRQDQRNR